MDLSVISINVNSIVSSKRKLSLGEFIHENPAHIYLLQEIKLGEGHVFHIHGFNIFRQNNSVGNRGTAILIKKNIPLRNTRTQNKNIEFTSVEAKIQNNWIKVYSFYIDSNGRAKDSEFNNLFKTNQNQFTLYGGDTNGRHPTFGDQSSNVNGIKAIKLLENPNLSIINPNSPTYYRTALGSYIDKFIIGNGSNIATSDITVLPSFSDHSGIKISIKLTPPEGDPTDFIIRRFNFTDIHSMNKYIERKTKEMVIPLNANIDVEGIEKIAINFKNIMETSIIRYVPNTKIKTNKIMLSSQTLSLQRECKKIQRNFFRLNPLICNFNLLNELQNRVKLLKKMIQASMGSDINNYYADSLADIQGPRDAYKNIKFHTSHKKIKKFGGNLYTDDTKQQFITGNQNIIEALASNFENIHNLSGKLNSIATPDINNSLTELNNNNDRIVFNQTITPKIETMKQLSKINDILPENLKNILTCTEEVVEIIKSRPNKKSTGSDEMSYFLIKFFGHNIIIFLTILFNHAISQSYFPKIWRSAQVISISKANKDPSILTNWRPISQLQCISKIFEKIMATRIIASTRNKNIFKTQFGFRGKISTEHALGTLQGDIEHGLNDGMITSVVSLDLRAAFDVVWHDGLIHKLVNLKFQPILIKLIKCMLTQRSFTVKLDGRYSTIRKINNGMPQSSVNSPLLFNIYIHDIPIDANVRLIQFADDTSIYLVHNNPLRAQNTIKWYLMNLGSYFRKWKLILNENKSEFINIMGTLKDTKPTLRRNCKIIKLSINGKRIKRVNQLRFLGIHMQGNNKFTNHVRIKLEKAIRAKFALSRILSSKFINSKTKTIVYKQYIRPIITYAAPIWCRQPNISSHQMELIRIFERKCLRKTANI